MPNLLYENMCITICSAIPLFLCSVNFSFLIQLQNCSHFSEEVFGSSNAIWFSTDGTKMAYVTFDDSGVRVMRVPHYGVPGSVNYQYTQHHEIRYPKVILNVFLNLIGVSSASIEHKCFFFRPSILKLET